MSEVHDNNSLAQYLSGCTGAGVLTSSLPPPGCACVCGPGGELCAAAGAAECFCRGDAGAALPAAALLSPLLHGWATLLQVGDTLLCVGFKQARFGSG